MSRLAEKSHEQLLAEIKALQKQVGSLESRIEAMTSTEQELRRSLNFHKEIIDDLPDMLIVIDRDYNVVMANQKALDNRYRQFNMGLQTKCYQLLHNHNEHCTAQDFDCPLLKVVQRQSPVTVEHIHHNHDNQPFNAEISAIPIFDENGDVIYIIEICRDITDRVKAEQALKAERNMFIAGPTMVFKWRNDAGWPVEYVSPNVETILGYTPEELREGNPAYSDIVHPDDLERVTKEVNDSVAAGVGNFEHRPYRLLCKNGDVIWCADYTTILRNKQGQATYFLGYVVDSTQSILAHEKLRISEERLSMVINGTNVGIWDWHIPDGRLVINERWAEMVGHTLEELQPLSIQAWIDLCHPEDLEKSNALLARHFAGETEYYICEARMRHKSGEWVWVLDQGKVFEWDDAGKPVRMAGTHLDINKRKMAAEILERTLKELQEANATKDKFFSIISHDLRSGFNNILSGARLIQTPEVKKRGQVDTLAAELHKSAKMQHELLENLLTWSRIQRDKIDFVPAPMLLCSSVHKVIEMMAPNARQKEIQLHNQIETELILVADRDMIQTVLRNLTSNAIKFTPPGGEISFRAQVENDATVVSVQDTGVGISERGRHQLFRIDSNYRADGTAGEKGTGLGLILCKEFIEKHGGKIWVESEQDRGSTFFFTIPRQTEKAGST